MRTFNVMRCVFSVSLTAAVLCACGGSSISLSADHNTTNAGDALKGNKTFYYTGKKQKFVVPARVRQLTVVAHGGQGGFSVYDSGNPAGFPARVYAIIPVHPGDTLYVRVGGSGAHGGFNGGGAGGSSDQASYPGYAGGGASDVRLGGDRLADRIIVAAGGGGVGVAIDRYAYGYGGNGGGSSGHSGGGGGGYAAGAGGAGGTQSQGGAGGAGGAVSSRGSYLSGQPGANGALGRGGNGGNAAPYCDAGGGGGGGGGYYGGGGGGGGAGAYSCINAGNGGGGGGGSSYVEPSAIKFRTWNGWKRTGDGLVVFSWN